MTSNSSLRLSALVLILVAAITFLTPGCKKEAEHYEPLKSEKYSELNSGMRKLWSDHMHWTLATVEAFYHNPNALNSNLDRLLQNQKDIGASIVPYYAQAAGDQLAALMTEHIQLAVPVLQAAQNNDQAALNSAVTNWKNNAKDIANFLTSANPAHWPQTATEPALLHHIDHTIDYSVKTLNNDHAGALVSFELALNHMLELADTLSEGIAKQFPEKF